MIINKLILENIRSHSYLEMGFENGITVITGRTGSGKSSILMSIEYALFGGESGISYSSMLRRGCEKGCITLFFEHEGKSYEIVRGFKRSSSGISFDKDNLRIRVNGSIIPVIERVKDFDEKIKQLIGYDAGIFGVMSYTRQDEIRKLVELKNEERQEYIDGILQLSKYKASWNNLREVISYYSVLNAELRAKISIKKSVEKEALELKAEKEEYEKKIRVIEAEAKRDEMLLENLEKSFYKKRNEKDELERIFEKTVSEKNRREYLDSRMQKIREALAGYDYSDEKSRTGEIEARLEAVKKRAYAIEALADIQKGELKNMDEVGGICPTCKQPVSKEHLDSFRRKTLKEISEKESRASSLKKEQEELEESLKNSKANDEKMRQALMLDSEMKSIKEELESIPENQKDYSLDLKKAREDYEKAFSDFSRLKSSSAEKRNSAELISQSLLRTAEKINEKESRLVEIEKDEKRLEKVSAISSMISKLRDDIKDIREEVRDSFLEQFKEDFQKRFEEIRRSDDDYTVDVLNNYEPVAYSSDGFETGIKSLSGGEKTSVALSYRIALSNIASEMADVSQSELLILDEPTLGFDSEDVRSLPEILEKIRIKQIIIVTHESELKSAANAHYIVDKSNGSSVVGKK